MKKIITWIISELLFRANSENHFTDHFYKIKNALLIKYGTHIGYDVQFIEGKKCHTCNGTGIFIGFYGRQYDDLCYRCSNGWYKRPTWNILEVRQVGKYKFHTPFSKVYKQPELETSITGYISHNRKKYGAACLFILFCLYEKGYLKRWYKMTGIGWRIEWWRPRNYIYNIIHIIKHGRKSIPFRHRPKPAKPQNYSQIPSEELPF